MIAGAPQAPAGQIAGVISILFLIGFAGYACFVFVRKAEVRSRDLAWPVLILAALGLFKLAALAFLPGLEIDVNSYRAWALRIVATGPARVYQHGYFLDYPPGYLYALWTAGGFAQLLGLGSEAQRVVIESPAIIADFFLALAVFVFIRRRAGAVAAWWGLAAVAFNPALLYDTVVWGQSDSVPALLMFLSVALLIDREDELGWGMAAIAALVKPQALLLLPVLGLWALLTADWRKLTRSAVAFAIVAIIIILPFQRDQPWYWIFSLYHSTAAYYHETSVNAFNLLALIAGLRQSDTTPVLGISAYAFGMIMLALLYALAARILWMNRSERGFLFTCFIVLLGAFVLGPRMHERYLYPALVFLVPLAVDLEAAWSPALTATLATLTVTFLANLVMVKRVLDAGRSFAPHDLLALCLSAINVGAFASALFCGFALTGARNEQSAPDRFIRLLRDLFRWTPQAAAMPASVPAAPLPSESDSASAPPWSRADSIAIAVLAAVGAVTRFWRIGLPAEIVFDEVHFVGQARHYLRGEAFLDPHPPLAKLLIALGIAIFGDHSWSWRVPNALLGILLVVLSYLLARRMFHSRLAATLAAAFIVCDGMFLVDSRIAVLDIVYVTFAAWSYLLLFRFVQSADLTTRRRTLLGIGLTLGLCLGSKLYIPAVAFLLVTGFLSYAIVREWPPVKGDPAYGERMRTWRRKHLTGALLLVGGTSAIVYLLVFIPHYLLGWWGGIEDLFRYYGQVVWYEKSVASATHPYAAPWWSWPLMIRPIAYWQNFPPKGAVATIWGGGNPALWWGALTAITITAVRGLERKTFLYAFLVAGYLGYLMIWIPIGRTLFLYHYMPAVYFGFLALAGVLADFWERGAEPYEQMALLLTLAPVFILGMGWIAGVVVSALAIGGYLWMTQRGIPTGRPVTVLFLAAALLLFLYYLPIWVGLPIERAGYYRRMWFQGPGLRNWI